MTVQMAPAETVVSILAARKVLDVLTDCASAGTANARPQHNDGGDGRDVGMWHGGLDSDLRGGRGEA